MQNKNNHLDQKNNSLSTIEKMHIQLNNNSILATEFIEKSLKIAKYLQNTNTIFTSLKDIKKIEEELKKNSKNGTSSNSLLYGIPYAVKDNILTKNFLTTASSRILSNFIAPYSATVVENLQKKGAIMIGKTNMDELGLGGESIHGYEGITKNPWDKTRIAGGSSGGSAVAVATGIVPFAIGSDTGNSIRLPAAYCGVVGFKPTYGSISRWGLLPYSPTCDTIGIFSQSVKDTEIVFSAIKGKDKKDLTTFKTNPNTKKKANDNKLTSQKLKILFLNNYLNKTIKPISNKFEQVKNKIARNYSSKMKVIEGNFPSKLSKLLPKIYSILAFADATSCQANLTGINFGKRSSNKKINGYEDTVISTRTENLGENIKKRYIIGAYALERQNQEKIYLLAKKTRNSLISTVQKLFYHSKFDIIIFPTTSNIAPKITKFFKKKKKKYYYHKEEVENLLLLGNLTGIPSISIPCGYYRKLPISLNINANLFEEKKLFKVARWIEQIVKFQNRLTK